jgi:hypothetical protein
VSRILCLPWIQDENSSEWHEYVSSSEVPGAKTSLHGDQAPQGSSLCFLIYKSINKRVKTMSNTDNLINHIKNTNVRARAQMGLQSWDKVPMRI